MSDSDEASPSGIGRRASCEKWELAHRECYDLALHPLPHPHRNNTYPSVCRPALFECLLSEMAYHKVCRNHQRAFVQMLLETPPSTGESVP